MATGTGVDDVGFVEPGLQTHHVSPLIVRRLGDPGILSPYRCKTEQQLPPLHYTLVSVNSSGVLAMGSSSQVKNSALSNTTVSLVLLYMSDNME
jgi:hypothetical protein